MAGSTWSVFSPATKAKSSEVNGNFDWIEGNIIPMNAGSATDAAYDLGAASTRWRHSYFSGRVNVPALGLSDTSFLSFDAGGTVTANIAMKMATGVAVTKYSSDGTLAGNSDLTIATEKATKTYVDTQIAAGVLLVSAQLASDTSINQVTSKQIQFTELLDVNGEFSSSTFSPLANGTYEFSFHAQLSIAGTTTAIGNPAFAVVKDGPSYVFARWVSVFGSSANVPLHFSFAMSLTAGATIQIHQELISGSTSPTMLVYLPVYFGDTSTTVLTNVPATYLQIRKR